MQEAVREETSGHGAGRQGEEADDSSRRGAGPIDR